MVPYQADEKAPFNMAIDTLRSINGILNEIHKIACDGTLSPAQKQSILVPLHQYFFFQSSALLKEEVVLKYQEAFINLKSCQAKVGIIKGGMIRREEVRLLYDPELELNMNRLLLAVIMELKREKYFMPPKKDLSRAITEM